MWRPNEWKCKYLGKKANRYFELGADAMLEEILIELQTIDRIPELGAFDKRLKEFIESLTEEVNG